MLEGDRDVQLPPFQARPLGGSIACECAVTRLPLRPAHIPAPWPLLPEVPSPKERRIARKMSLIRRSGLFGADTRGAKISRAATLEDLRDAYKLVHRIYLGNGYISEEQAEMRLRIFETSPDTATFIAKKDGRVVGVLSIVHDSEAFGLPSDEAFSEELRLLRATGRKIGEITNQAVDEAFRSSAVPTELMRCALAHGIEAGFDLGIAAVSPSHNAFYELLGFRQIGGRRSYSGKIHDPVVPLQIDLAAHRNPQEPRDEVEEFTHAFLTAQNPYFLYVKAWEYVASERFRAPELLRGLFIQERNFIGECTDAQRQALEAHWGEDLFAMVTGPLFVKSLPPLVPQLSELDAPRPGVFSLSLHQAATGALPTVDDALAHDRCVKEIGMSEADVQRLQPAVDHEREIDRTEHRLGRRFAEASIRSLRQVGESLASLWRHSVFHTPREAN